MKRLKAMIFRKTGRTSRRKSGDWLIAAMGLALGVTCALFPWYIFFNQEKFGVRALQFSGSGNVTAATSLAAQPQRIGAPISADEVPISQLDLFTTAGVAKDSPPAVAALHDQPFPADVVEYRLVHVANGRAMIEDKDGLWIVQVGSILPDSSRVMSLEKREGKWALVTSGDKIVPLAE
jgi:hypothetical protein